MIRTTLRQGSPAWIEARRSLITATDLPVLLGLSPYKCEADLADEKRTGSQTEATLRMQIGSTLQPLIGEEYARITGRRVKPVADLWRHPSIEWAAASPDFKVVGEQRLVEAKRSTSRSRFADGLPQDVEAQVAWQLGVSGYPVADVAVLLGDDALTVYEQAADPVLFDNLLTVAADFRRRLAEGGPFARDAARIRRDYPADNGAELVADAELTAAIHALVDLRTERKALEGQEEALESAIKARMGEIAVLRGQGFHVTWKRTRDSEAVDWKSIADGLLRQLAETERDALVGLHTNVRPGFRPFRLVLDKED